jgi:hypothetical protein
MARAVISVASVRASLAMFRLRLGTASAADATPEIRLRQE